MPLAPSAKRKNDGSPYTPEDAETYTTHVAGFAQQVQRVPFFELEQNGGVRRYEARYFPMTVFQAHTDGTQGKVTVRDTIAKNEQHLEELVAQGWHKHPDAAKDAYEGSQRAIAQAAAEVAYAAQSMTEPARREYRKRSADSPTHITE
jgi:hypothetical protein